MNISPISSQNTATKKGSKIGTVAGLGASGTFLVTQAKKGFISDVLDKSVREYESKCTGIFFSSLYSAGVIAAGALAGKLVGTVIGKIVDSAKQHKE